MLLTGRRRCAAWWRPGLPREATPQPVRDLPKHCWCVMIVFVFDSPLLVVVGSCCSASSSCRTLLAGWVLLLQSCVSPSTPGSSVTESTVKSVVARLADPFLAIGARPPPDRPSHLLLCDPAAADHDKLLLAAFLRPPLREWQRCEEQ